MRKYIAKRIAVSVPIILGVILITFVLMNYIPGNAVTAMMQNKINNETVARVDFGTIWFVYKRFITWRFGNLFCNESASIQSD